MRSILPQALLHLADTNTFPIYVVGGTCRDFLAGLKPRAYDFDLCAPVHYERFIEAAKDCGFVVCSVYANTGTVKLSDSEHSYEFSTFRSDEYVRGRHVPVATYFTDDIKKDALRRDFTVNAVYYDIAKGTFCDPLCGMADITNRRMRTVREAERVFGEDGLRLMRLCRQASALNFEPTEECIGGARANAKLICDISAERIFAELCSILQGDETYGYADAPYRGLKMLHEIGVLAYILPELAEGDGMAQRADFHDHDVLEHSFRCVRYAPKEVRLAALLHDVGKPKCMKENGKFAEHEIEGALLTAQILGRWKAGKKLTDQTCRLVRLHMYDYDGKTRENKVRRVIVQNLDILENLLSLKQADYSACKDNLGQAPVVQRWRNILQQMKKEGIPLSLKELKIRGDLLIANGIPPKEVGTILEKLLNECVSHAVPNTQARLLKMALQLHAQGDNG